MVEKRPAFNDGARIAGATTPNLSGPLNAIGQIWNYSNNVEAVNVRFMESDGCHDRI